ncbi:MAG: flagellar hook-associated protein FlgK [Planctomycetes bacterium]|nr:flagellar hook-associated protein FlgK [Planctomycetota bacterium]
MSLSNAMQIGRSALAVSQAGISVTSNNIANAGTAGYARQIARMEPIQGAGADAAGAAGRGVRISQVRRQVDQAIEHRLRGAISDEASANQNSLLMGQIESVLGTIGDGDLSNQLSQFFNTWSERANGTRTSASVVQQGQQLSNYLSRLRSDLRSQTSQIDGQLSASVSRANTILGQIADLNTAIAGNEQGGNEASALRDQRDIALTELSSLMRVSTVEHENGAIDVLVGSTPVILGGRSRGLELSFTSGDDGSSEARIVTRNSAERIDMLGGSIGALVEQRVNGLGDTLASLDRIASQLAFNVNRYHSTGTNAQGLTGTSSQVAFATADRALALNSASNQTMAALPYVPQDGSFKVQMKNTATGETRTVQIRVDLDGLTDAGLPGTDDDTTAQDIVFALNAVPGLNAGFSSEGKLTITSDSGYAFAFQDDSSNVLAALQVNSYFTGTTASSLSVRSDLVTSPSSLVAGRWDASGNLVENGTALAIARLRDEPNSALGGASIVSSWSDTAQRVGDRAATARIDAEASTTVRANLEGQRANVSGVSTDEESLNLMQYQRQYQGAARLISVCDELMQTLMQLV